MMSEAFDTHVESTVPCLPLLLQLSHSHFFSSALEDMVLIMADFIALLVNSVS